VTEEPVVTERRVELGGPLNFRDLGGYRADEGRIVRWRHVFRSDSLHHLTEDDGRRLGELGIVSALDFRARDELVEIGIGHLGELDIHHVHLPTADRALHSRLPDDWEPPSSATDVYLTMLETSRAAYAEALRTLVVPGALPAVYFCMAGKDRTGLFSALLLGLLGVGDDDIVADYALTHEVVEEIHARGAESSHFSDVWHRLPADILGAHTATMEGTLAGVRERWDGWDGYTEAAGVEPEVVQALRAELLTAP
jgi:protein-tyrosine phosphatase